MSRALAQNFWSATFDGLTFGAIYALVALGYTLVYGVLNLINFAHSEVFIMGCYAVFFTLSFLGFGPSAPNLSFGANPGQHPPGPRSGHHRLGGTCVPCWNGWPTGRCASAMHPAWST